MNFKDLDLNISYDSNKPGVNILRDFYIPALKNSIKYDRVGSYFRSSVFLANSKGIVEFIKNGGEIRLILDVTLTKEDLEAIENGEDGYAEEKIKIY